MAPGNYKQQVSLLLQVLPEIAKEPKFALHGGTAINLFVRDMPRMSVDIDITYTEFDDREAAVKNILNSLDLCKERIQKVIPGADIHQNTGEPKIVVSSKGAVVKIEVNTTNRGLLTDAITMELCKRAQKEFASYCTIKVVSESQLFGGKLIAALDRQHPRDIFDLRSCIDEKDFFKKIKTGFLLCLISSGRPTHELLSPNLIDHRQTLKNQFSGMTDDDLTYEEFKNIRNTIIQMVKDGLTNEDKKFILSIHSLEPIWDIYNFEKFPAVQWKIQNLKTLKEQKPDKYKELITKFT